VVAVATTNGKKMDAQNGNGEDEAEVGEEEEQQSYEVVEEESEE